MPVQESHTPGKLRERIGESDETTTDARIKGTPADTRVSDLSELFESETHRDMTVYTVERGGVKIVGAQIEVATFSQLQQVFNILGSGGIEDSGLTQTRTFAVEYQFD